MGNFSRIEITPEEASAAQSSKGQPAPAPVVAPAPVKAEATAAAERPANIPEKFWKDGKVDTDAMAKSYTELEKSKAAPAPAPVAPIPADVAVPGVEAADQARYSTELAAGKLSDASYAELATKGYSKAAVDAYIKGITTVAAAQPAVEVKPEVNVQEAIIADRQITEIKASIGGDAVLVPMLAWAKTGLTAAESKEYEAAVSSGDVAKVKMAVAGLHALYTKEVGSDPQLLGGKAATESGDSYASKEEMVSDMQQEKYKKDPAERQRVANKLRRSKIV